MIKAITAKVENESQKNVEAVLTAFAEVVIETLMNDKNEKIPLPKLGTFSIKDVSERKGISALGEHKAWVKPAHSEIKFKINKNLKNI